MAQIWVDPMGRLDVERTEASDGRTIGPVDVDGHWLADARAAGAARRRRVTNPAVRGLDLVVASSISVVALPAMAAVAVASLVFDRGPVLFRQPRVGRDGRIFGCLKFRTMRVDAEAALASVLRDPVLADEWARTQKLQDDPRVTRLGAVLRRLDLDELPQLWNVLRGDMSLVGPRPVVIAEAERYGADLAEVLSVRPGLTGAWQVSGRNAVAYPDRIQLDLDYVRNRSIRGDLRILLDTVSVVVRPPA